MLGNYSKIDIFVFCFRSSNNLFAFNSFIDTSTVSILSAVPADLFMMKKDKETYSLVQGLSNISLKDSC
jgi:hypothetical protein